MRGNQFRRTLAESAVFERCLRHASAGSTTAWPQRMLCYRSKMYEAYTARVKAAPMMPQRMLCYWSKMYAHQLIRGQIYDKLNPLICMAFWGIELDARKGYMRRIVPWEQAHQVVFSEHLELYLFEMPKFSLLLESGIPNKREQ